MIAIILQSSKPAPFSIFSIILVVAFCWWIGDLLFRYSGGQGPPKSERKRFWLMAACYATLPLLAFLAANELLAGTIAGLASSAFFFHWQLRRRKFRKWERGKLSKEDALAMIERYGTEIDAQRIAAATPKSPFETGMQRIGLVLAGLLFVPSAFLCWAAATDSSRSSDESFWFAVAPFLLAGSAYGIIWLVTWVIKGFLPTSTTKP